MVTKMSLCTSQPNYKHAQFKRSYQNNARENPHIMNVAESDINYQPGIQAKVTKKNVKDLIMCMYITILQSLNFVGSELAQKTQL